MQIEIINCLSRHDPLEPKVYRCSDRCANSLNSCSHVQDVRIDVDSLTFIASVKSRDRVTLRNEANSYYGETYEFSRKSRYDKWACKIKNNVSDQDPKYFFPETFYRLSTSMNEVVKIAYEKKEQEERNKANRMIRY